MRSEPQRVLELLAAADERLLETVMAPAPEGASIRGPDVEPLDRRTRLLVTLAALIAAGAPTAALQWVVELASAAGAGVDTLTGVLLSCAPAVGTAGVVESAPRLALALGFDLELDGWDGT
jgi:alkylhydroperoxidase/carboxymuconolactone decarboxylase family protein YurZ